VYSQDHDASVLQEMLAYYQRSCCEVQSKSTLSDKIFTEAEEYILGYSENPDFLWLKTRGTE
jgi:hypothetical protein